MSKIRIVRNNAKFEVPVGTTLEDVIEKYVPPSWEKVFEENSGMLKHAVGILKGLEESGHQIIPRPHEVFADLYNTELSKVKVVIVGQDPYPSMLSTCDSDGVQQSRACGMSFCQRLDDTSVASSLNNIYKELVDCGFSRPDHGDLSSWASQGVLMVNMSRTLALYNGKVAGKKHFDLWEGFLLAIFRAIAAYNRKCVVVLWGKVAGTLELKISNSNFRYVTAAHPSGLNTGGGFLGKKQFTLINKYLQADGVGIVNWSIPNRSDIIELRNAREKAKEHKQLKCLPTLRIVTRRAGPAGHMSTATKGFTDIIKVNESNSEKVTVDSFNRVPVPDRTIE